MLYKDKLKFYAAKKEQLVVQNRPAEVVSLEEQGVAALNAGDFESAFSCFEAAEGLYADAAIRSYLAFCVAAVKNEYKKAMSMAIQSLREDPGNPTLYLNLGRIQVLAGRKRDAVRMFLQGQAREGRVKDSMFHEDLVQLGVRKQPPIPFLSRGHFLNKYLGLILNRVGLR